MAKLEPGDKVVTSEIRESDQPNWSGSLPPRGGFHSWWRSRVDDLAPDIQRKAEEYGTNSLAEMGRMLARAQGREVDQREAIELGCAVYAKGKLERVLDAALKGKTPSSDTWADLMVYAAMAQYVRDTGDWP